MSAEDAKTLWVIKISVLATADEVEQLTDDLITTICPSPDHEGDCATPWSMITVNGSSLSKRKQAQHREQIRLTNP